MRRHIAVFVSAVTSLLLVSATPVMAISNGEIDDAHTNVGVMAVEYAPGSFFHPCTGTLIAPDVFLVAAHCLAGLSFFSPEQVFVTFDVNFFTASNLVPAKELHFDPAFLESTEADPHDLGVIILSAPVTGIDPAELPTAGLLDELAAHGGLRHVSFVNVGYGWSASFQGGRPSYEIDGNRRVSTSPFKALTPTLLKELNNNNATGEGGACFVDSGSPKFLPDTDIVFAVQLGGDPKCRAESVASRLDIPQARAFLGLFVDLP